MAMIRVFTANTRLTHNTDTCGCSSPFNIHGTGLETENRAWRLCESRCSRTWVLSQGARWIRSWKGMATLSRWEANQRRREASRVHMNVFFKWKEYGWRWISNNLILLVFGETYIYTHKPHTVFIASRPNSTWFPTFPPLSLGKL